VNAIETAARRRGVIAALCAYVAWGLFPIYWKWMGFADPAELVAHRVLWSTLVYLALTQRRFGIRELWPWFCAGRTTVLAITCALLLACNWLLFVASVASGQVLQSSLGYFMTPLFNIALGLAFMREKLRPLQWAAVAICFVGVVRLLAMAMGWLGESDVHVEPPWLALGMATTFSLYGYGRKRIAMQPLIGSTFEGVALSPLALCYLIGLEWAGKGAFGRTGAAQDFLLMGSGLVTAIPLLAFGIAVKELPLSVVGFFQYLAPSISFCLAIWVYDEAWTSAQAQAFAMIWLGLAMVIVDQLMTYRRAYAIRSARAEPQRAQSAPLDLP
jgi:chloramphenicol-sensitive protein RarD